MTVTDYYEKLYRGGMGTLIHRDSTPERPLALAHYFFLEDLMGLLWLYSIFLISTTTRKRDPY